MESKNVIGERLRVARTHKNPVIQQLDLHARLEIDGYPMPEGAISKIERGERSVTDKDLLALAETLQVSVLWLLGLEKDWPKPKIR